MKPSTRESSPASVDRQALRRRVLQMYRWFEQERWEKCFSLVDPRLKEQSKVQIGPYSERMRVFKEVYGRVHLWTIEIHLHTNTRSSQHDKRNFAYVYVFWRDAAMRFHTFQERWVKDAGRWFTRVAGLVPARANTADRSKPSTPR